MKVLRMSLLLIMLFSLMSAICYGQTAEDYCDKGVDYADKGMFDKAMAECKRALEINPEFGGAHEGLAIAYYYKGEYSLAIEHFDRAMELGQEVDPEWLKDLEQYRKR